MHDTEATSTCRDRLSEYGISLLNFQIDTATVGLTARAIIRRLAGRPNFVAYSRWVVKGSPGESNRAACNLQLGLQ